MAKSTDSWRTLNRAINIHIVYGVVYGALAAAYQAWRLFAPSAQRLRWILVILLLGSALAAKLTNVQASSSLRQIKRWVVSLIILDILVASVNVFSERGMASRGVALFALPIIAAAAVSMQAVWRTAFYSAVGYAVSLVAYFTLHPSEGYKIELYGTLALYSGIFFVLAAMVNAVSNL